MYKKITILIIIILFCISNLNAQQGISMGLGNAYTAIARGPEAIFWNPANLALSNNLPNFNFNIYSIGANFGNNAFDIDFYDEYLTGTGQKDADGNKIGKTLTDNDKKDILSRIPDSGLELMGKVDVSVLGFSFKNYGASVEFNMFTEGTLPKNAF